MFHLLESFCSETGLLVFCLCCLAPLFSLGAVFGLFLCVACLFLFCVVFLFYHPDHRVPMMDLYLIHLPCLLIEST